MANVLAAEEIQPPKGIQVLGRQLRIDLIWNGVPEGGWSEVQRASRPDGPFTSLTQHVPNWPMHSDFLGTNGGEFYYRVRFARTNASQHSIQLSGWSTAVMGSPQPLIAETLLTEIQEAGFRYFYEFAHPVSGLAREGTDFMPDFCAIGASGMGFFNLGVGVERKFITRRQGAERVLKMLRFLSEKADKFHGAFPHFLNGRTGKTNPFFDGDDGADIVETAFLMQGILFVREYFSGTDKIEQDLRELANSIWHGVEWEWFAHDEGDSATLIWRWSPTRGWGNKLRITGFNECHMVYLLALVSPTHPVSEKFYRQGWETRKHDERRSRFGIPIDLGHDMGPPLFWTHYSYLGLDPHQIAFRGQSCFIHFQNLSRVQVSYAESRRGDFKGYGKLWGVTASNGPDGYRPFAPGAMDEGTIAPTAALSSMPYVPEASQSCLMELYKNHGDELWGPFGFYDAFNQNRGWVSNNYLGIDVGPISPMIENYRTGMCWRTFTRAPEIKKALNVISSWKSSFPTSAPQESGRPPKVPTAF